MSSSANFQKVTVKMERILRSAQDMIDKGKPATMGELARASGYDFAGEIAAEVNYLVKHGYAEKMGTPGTRGVHLVPKQEMVNA